MSVMRPASRLYLLHLRRLSETGLRKPRFERAIGVIYRPETEPASHYFQAVLPDQFDEYVWFDETRAITPFDTKALEGLPTPIRSDFEREPPGMAGLRNSQALYRPRQTCARRPYATVPGPT